ncbi:suppressor protein stp22 of temperature-sensitive alpha-factor receptor and arginine permease [Coemansia sp. Benny D115]|nr:suppressor protein stp22 of temperature-sensitive alpha-factor receptor and arginine permease [Coemansia sp. Benny D115]
MSLGVTRQWLRENTSRRFEDANKVYELVDEGITQFRSLKPKIAEYVAEDKSIQALLCLHGTLPVVFNGAKFNIPVVFWFPRKFPDHPPMAYVTPTQSMVVKVSQHVDERGRIYHPYLAGWTAETSSLVELFAKLIAIFSIEPPVYSRPPGYMAAAISPAVGRPKVGAASMSSLPQVSAAAAAAAGGHSAFVRPMSVAESDLASIHTVNSLADSIVSTQGLSQMGLNASNASIVAAASAPSPATSSATQQPVVQAESPSKYKFNPVPGRPPVPTLSPMISPNSVAATTEPNGNNTQTNGDSQADASTESKVESTSVPADNTAVAALAAAIASSRAQQAAMDIDGASSERSKRWSMSESEHSATEHNDAQATVAKPTQQATMEAPIVREDPAANSLLDSEPMDDPMKRHIGYQLAIYDRVSDAVNKSREKHTRVNKELLDQSANLHSGAGVIAEERQQLMESQRQLTANISVLENKLNELSNKKAEFPDAAQISDVTKVFRGQTRAMEQLFDLAGDIAAIDDTLYVLGKALNDGKLPLNIYMRQVRKLSQQHLGV